jgi:hypothetical protein
MVGTSSGGGSGVNFIVLKGQKKVFLFFGFWSFVFVFFVFSARGLFISLSCHSP